MKYKKEERLEIGRQVYTGEITSEQAKNKYGIAAYTVKEYVRLYRETNSLPYKNKIGEYGKLARHTERKSLEEYESMTKEELIDELIRARITEARLKKGYEVKGDGTVIRYTKKNTK